MAEKEAVAILENEDAVKRNVYHESELNKLFCDDGKTVRELVAEDILRYMGEDVYVYAKSRNLRFATMHKVAQELRPGCLVYESFESMASQWGLISQIPMRITFATTGKTGEYFTPYGALEFTHTDVPENEIRKDLIDVSELGQLPMANEELTVRDMEREKRSLDLLYEERMKNEGGLSGTVRYYS